MIGPAYYWCRLKPEEVADLTPAEVNLLIETAVKRYDDESQADDFRFAQLIALYATVNRDTKKHPAPYRPDDFMPKRQPVKQPAEKTRDQTEDEMLNMIKFANTMFGGDKS